MELSEVESSSSLRPFEEEEKEVEDGEEEWSKETAGGWEEEGEGGDIPGVRSDKMRGNEVCKIITFHAGMTEMHNFKPRKSWL